MRSAMIMQLGVGAARGLSAIERFKLRYAAVCTGALAAALTPEERTALTLRLQSVRPFPQRVGALDQTGAGTLFDWERRWYQAALPQPPARILLPAAGTGREALALTAMGYRVHAFEPHAGAVAPLQASVGQDGLAWCSDFDSFVSDTEEHGWGTPSRDPYDAVIVGWGSFTHLYSDSARLRLLQACRRHTRGPILISFWRTLPGASAGTRPRRLAAAVARRARFGTQAAENDPIDRYHWDHRGFFVRYSRQDIVDLAARAGEQATFPGADAHTYGHATLHPLAR